MRSPDRRTTPNGMEYILVRDGLIHIEALDIIERLDNEIAELRSCINTGCDALADSVTSEDNPADQVMDIVRRLRGYTEKPLSEYDADNHKAIW